MSHGIHGNHGLSILQEDGCGVAQVLPFLPIHDDLAVPLIGKIDPNEGIMSGFAHK
jgi:hypothetical protein